MTDYYVQVIDGGLSVSEQFWAVGDGVAHRGIIPSPIGTNYADEQEDIMATLQKRGFPVEKFHKLLLKPGEYFPRMARPDSTLADCSPGRNPDESIAVRDRRTIGTGQLHALIQWLQGIFRVIHPGEDNFSAYGHEIGNIIIIACTEIEAQWKGILKANAQSARNRNDYVKLSSAMRLTEYRVALPWYPWIEPITPFEKWIPPEHGERQHLPWYDAYNDIKHDRENKFIEAKLIYALEAVTGYFVMLCAQYGWDFAKRDNTAENAFFLLVEAPRWRPSEIYVPPFGKGFHARSYPFRIS